MLAVLLYHVGEPVRLETIVEHLWVGRGLDECRMILYTLASRIRAVLNDVGLPNALVRGRGVGAYRLDVDPDLIDFHRFRRAVREARDALRQHQYDVSVALLADAVDAWRDEPLADLRGARAEHLRVHMHNVLLDPHQLLAESELRVGRYHSVLAHGPGVVSLCPSS
jgi:two-component SAPR family response regulator